MRAETRKSSQEISFAKESKLSVDDRKNWERRKKNLNNVKQGNQENTSANAKYDLNIFNEKV